MTVEPDARSLYLRNGYAHLGRLPDRTIIDDLTAEAARLYEQPPTRRELLTNPGEIALNMHRLLAVEQRSEVIARTLADPVLIDTAAVFLGNGLAGPAGATLLCAPPRSPAPRPVRLPRPEPELGRTGDDRDLVHLWFPLPSEQVLRVAFLSHTDTPPLGPWARRRARRRRAVGCGMCAGDGFAVHPHLRVGMAENPGLDLRFAAVLTYRRQPEHPHVATTEAHR